ncbi:unnamed protein product [Nezara viridula]|uniref:Uncharacterized protein n=1 Tax=Nezara viridula TaxID=85310 RepID=A0A9P0HDJ9_NEZVI|nr:unnamed protein product [Nezara viridula]
MDFFCLRATLRPRPKTHRPWKPSICTWFVQDKFTEYCFMDGHNIRLKSSNEFSIFHDLKKLFKN